MTALAFVSWARLSVRTVKLARVLKSPVVFCKDRPPYIRAAFMTLRQLLRLHPHAVVLQLPPGPLLLVSLVLKKILGFRLVADAHTGFIYTTYMKEKLLNAPFVTLLRHCDLVVIHNKPIKFLLPRDVRGKALFLPDPLPRVRTIRPPARVIKLIKGERYLLLPASFAPDEPLSEVVEAARELRGAKIVVTGDWRRALEIARMAREVPSLVLTGYLPEDEYYYLLANAHAVVALTKREFTFLSAALEGLSFGRPLILSDTLALRTVFTRGALFVPREPSADDLARAFNAILDETTWRRLRREIAELRTEYVRMWKRCMVDFLKRLFSDLIA